MLKNVLVFIFVCLFNLKLTTPQSISSTSGINLIQTIEELEDEVIKLPNNLTQFTYYNTKIRGVCPKSLKGAEGIKCETIESQCYCFIWNPRKSWWDARNFCRHHGMDLVSFETPDEENRVALKVFENFKDNVTAGHVPPGISFFSSGQRKFQNKDDSQYLYLWSSTGTIIPEARLTKDWHTGEPTFAWEGEAENCIQWHVILGSHPLDIKITWNDWYTQDEQNRFIRYFESSEPQVRNGMAHIHDEVGPFNPIVVKCYLTTFRNEGIEIRRFFYKNPEDPTIQKLKACCKVLYPQLQKEEFELMYLDEDNDKVALSTDPELEVIWLETKSSGQQLRLYIHVI